VQTFETVKGNFVTNKTVRKLRAKKAQNKKMPKQNVNKLQVNRKRQSKRGDR